MKIVSLHISRFGKLKDVNLNFSDGINVFQHQNGFGKTTLAAFIRAMLFGFRYNSAKLSTGERGTDVSRWLPWDADGKIGGSLTVEQNGEIYRVERYFGAKASQETLAGYNEKNGKKLDVQNVGETFLGLTAESFDRSTYFPQESVEISSNENLDARLAGLVQNAEDYNAVCNRLADFRKKLSLSRGKGGLIFELERQEMNLQGQIFERKRALARQKEIDDRIARIAVEKAAAENAAMQCNQRVESLQRQTAQAQPSAEQLANEQKLAALQEKLNRQKDLPQDFETCRQLAEKITQTPQEAKTQRQLSLPLLIVGLALLAAGVGLCFWQIVLGVCVAAVGVVCGVLAFFVRPALSTLPSGEKDALVSQYFAIVAKYVFCNNLDYSQAQEALWEVYRQYIGDKSTFDALLETRSATRTADVASLQQALENEKQRANQAQQRLQLLAKENGALSSERNALNVDVISP
ncbi:MAG: ATP-binding protein, partial [Candidatus Fimimonas sp.]